MIAIVAVIFIGLGLSYIIGLFAYEAVQKRKIRRILKGSK
jgi:hypothetical protein